MAKTDGAGSGIMLFGFRALIPTWAGNTARTRVRSYGGDCMPLSNQSSTKLPCCTRLYRYYERSVRLSGSPSLQCFINGIPGETDRRPKMSSHFWWLGWQTARCQGPESWCEGVFGGIRRQLCTLPRTSGLSVQVLPCILEAYDDGRTSLSRKTPSEGVIAGHTIRSYRTIAVRRGHLLPANRGKTLPRHSHDNCDLCAIALCTLHLDKS